MMTSLTDRFIEGMMLAKKGDFSQAHALLAECVAADPANFDYVDGFLHNLARRARLSDSAPRPDVAQQQALAEAAARKDWKTVLALGPLVLAGNPWHGPTLFALADASAASGFDQAELRYLQMAYESGPADLDINRHCARSLGRLKKYDAAIDSWRRVSELAPGDEEAAQMMASLAIEKSRELAQEKRKVSSPSGLAAGDDDEEELAPAGDPDPDGPDQDTAEIDLTADAKPRPVTIRVSTEDSPTADEEPSLPGEIRLTPVQKLEAAIRDYPSNPEYYVELTPMYLQRGREYDAERMLAKGKTLTDDLRVQQLWEDVAMLRLAKKIELAKQAAAKGPDPEAEAHLAELRRERDRFETEVFASRAHREPGNAAIRLQLGLRLRQAGKTHEANECFIEALPDPVQKAAAALEIGRSHEEQNEYPVALQHYRLAAEAAANAGQLDARKQALYLAGRLARRIKMERLAERYLGELVRLDPNYREAASWLKELRR